MANKDVCLLTEISIIRKKIFQDGFMQSAALSFPNHNGKDHDFNMMPWVTWIIIICLLPFGKDNAALLGHVVHAVAHW